MPAVRITIGGREYQVACDDGQEGHLKSLARLLDERVKGMGISIARVSESQLLILAALMLTDELQDASRDLAQLREETHHNSQSFETSKQIQLESAVAATIHDIASRVEAIAGELEKI